MPAISLRKLNESIEQIWSLLEQPLDLFSYLIAFYETYADQTFHPGDKSNIDPRLPHYNVPPVITMRMQEEFSRIAQEHPDKAYVLVSALWNNRHYEIHTLACIILGHLPIGHSEQFFAKTEELLSTGIEPFFLEPFFKLTSQSILKSDPLKWHDRANAWLGKDSIKSKVHGLMAYKILISSQSYDDLPLLMQGLQPFLSNPHPLLIEEGAEVLLLLLEAFPEEMGFYINELQKNGTNPHKDLLLRKALKQHHFDVSFK